MTLCSFWLPSSCFFLRWAPFHYFYRQNAASQVDPDMSPRHEMDTFLKDFMNWGRLQHENFPRGMMFDNTMPKKSLALFPTSLVLWRSRMVPP